jgi:hypothetical protein
VLELMDVIWVPLYLLILYLLAVVVRTVGRPFVHPNARPHARQAWIQYSGTCLRTMAALGLVALLIWVWLGVPSPLVQFGGLIGAAPFILVGLIGGLLGQGAAFRKLYAVLTITASLGIGGLEAGTEYLTPPATYILGCPSRINPRPLALDLQRGDILEIGLIRYGYHTAVQDTRIVAPVSRGVFPLHQQPRYVAGQMGTTQFSLWADPDMGPQVECTSAIQVR